MTSALLKPNSEKGQLASVAIKIITSLLWLYDYYKGGNNFDIISIGGFTADFLANLVSQQKDSKNGLAK
jgi:hypothetical protein